MIVWFRFWARSHRNWVSMKKTTFEYRRRKKIDKRLLNKFKTKKLSKNRVYDTFIANQYNKESENAKKMEMSSNGKKWLRWPIFFIIIHWMVCYDCLKHAYSPHIEWIYKNDFVKLKQKSQESNEIMTSSRNDVNIRWLLSATFSCENGF